MKPTIVLVGRPNVGKSTLFNRIIGRREAIVEERPGVTRDRKEVEAEWRGRPFRLVDTGGWLPSGTELDDKVSRQSEKAIAEADVILLVTDTTVGVTEEDSRVADLLPPGARRLPSRPASCPARPGPSDTCASSVRPLVHMRYSIQGSP